jgi:subtilisin family serine protease
MRRIKFPVSCFVIALTLTFTSQTARCAPEYVEGEVIVTFKQSVSLDSAKKSLDDRAAVMTKHFPYLSSRRRRQTGLVRRPGRTTAQLIDELKQDPSVETVEPNYVRRISAQLPNDSAFSQLWALQNTGQFVVDTTGTTGADIKFVGAWQLARSSTNEVVVAIIDTGANYNHPDLVSNIWTNPGEIPGNNTDDDLDGYVDDYHGYNFADHTSDPMDADIHGTHVAGTIAAIGNNLIGVIGVDYRAKVMPLRASSDGMSLPDSAIIEALQYATMMKGRGVNIVAINASFGGPGFDTAMMSAIQLAGDAGIIFCAAAGNDGSDNDSQPTYPASYGLPNMIVVAASDQNDSLAWFSNFGANSVDLAAPGVNILSTLSTNTAYVVQGATTYTATAMTFSGTTPGITAGIYDCGLGMPTNFPPAVSNNIALILRGSLNFSDKVANAMGAHARAAIIYNNVAGSILGTLQFASNWIPTFSISQSDGLAILSALPGTGTVFYAVDPATADSAYEYLDGTSMATPHVAGAVAFAAMNFPDENVTQRVARVLANVDVLPSLQGIVRTGGRLNLQRIVDTDANNLPDWWEQLYFGQLTGVDPDADPDHDGASNLAEWLAGTNPTNAASSLRLTAHASSTNSVILNWPSVSGKIYRLERATNLVSGFDSVVHTNITATAPTNTDTDAILSSGGPRFYRVRVDP